DAGQPWTSDCPYRCSRLYLRVPRWLVQDRLGMETLPALPRISGRSRLGAALSHVAATLYRDAEDLSTDEGSAMMSAYLDILARCIRPAHLSATLHRGAQLRTEVDRFIDANIQDPGLTPAQIAAATGISVRHLHRLFG